MITDVCSAGFLVSASAVFDGNGLDVIAAGPAFTEDLFAVFREIDPDVDAFEVGHNVHHAA